MEVTSITYTKLLRENLCNEDLNPVELTSKRRSKMRSDVLIDKFSRPTLTTLQSSQERLKEKIPSNMDGDPIISLALLLTRGKSKKFTRERSISVRKKELCPEDQTPNCSTETTNHLPYSRTGEIRKVKRTLKKWPRGLVRATRAMKETDREETAQSVRTAMLLKGLETRIP